MNRNRILLGLLGLSLVLLVGALTYSFVRNDDSYKYFTGLGDSFSISPDDKSIVFSYYQNGKEAIYTAKIDGRDVTKITEPNHHRHHDPKYSPNGGKLLYLSKNNKGVNTLCISNRDGTKPRRLTDKSIHVGDTVFSPSADKIYFTGIPAEDLKRKEGEKKNGVDLYSVSVDGSHMKQLTNDDRFTMDNLSISKDGKVIYFSDFDGNSEKIRSYLLEEGRERGPISPKGLSGDMSAYHSQLSPDGKWWAFTAVSKKAQHSSLFEYDLFLMDTKTGRTKRMTDLNDSVMSPVFFHHGQKIAFLENTNWAAEPAEYRLRTINLESKKLGTIHLDMPAAHESVWFGKLLDRSVNGFTIAVLYIILFALGAVYMHYNHPKRSYLPAIISFVLSISLFIASFIVAGTIDPWMAIGVGIVSAGIFICSIIVFIFTFGFKRVTSALNKKRL
ncbi:Tol biopolymer transport system component [Scopulibacillus darangshiensis]|uniref:Tol biopolymer transport system component n=1 Tax=Scopulibacillus darangshiensis TaxID=442528 RepID=A0A4V2SN60_9BACL|nr:DPP IV N-terminal domain-containing protein [Scopulibacillus darangshiensis]TCP29926.1 Tol biopolymer transport system component [Scopulibacillus darangshiensis]